MKKRIAVLYIATGRYIVFWKNFYKSCEKYFLKNYQKDYFVFTDSTEFAYSNKNNVNIIHQEHLGWPYDTMLRFDMFLRKKNELLQYDYIYFFNANIEFIAPINEEVLPNNKNEGLVVQLHPACLFVKNPDKYAYDRNPNSQAYIPLGHGKYYFAGGLNGGKANEYIKMCEKCSQMIHTDMSNNIIPLWHDESILNKYMLDKTPLILPVYYMFREEYLWDVKYNLENLQTSKIKTLLKTKTAPKYGGHDYMRGITNRKAPVITSYLKYFLTRFIQKSIKQSKSFLIKFDGTLGDNMFQYAFGLWYQKTFNKRPAFNWNFTKTLSQNFYINPNLYRLKRPLWLLVLSKIPLTKKYGRSNIAKFYELPTLYETEFSQFRKTIDNINLPKQAIGKFLNYKYLELNEKRLYKDFKLKTRLDKTAENILQKIKTSNSIAVCYDINIDFEYYQKAISYISKQVPDFVLFIFTNNIEQTKFNANCEKVYIDTNSIKEEFLFELIRNCKHNIIDNSSIAYMSAYLNKNSNKIVINPNIQKENELTPIYPPDWICM